MSVSKNSNINQEIILGIDYGSSKIGLAIGRNNLVMPIENIKNTDEMASIHKITRIIYENKIDTVVMGLPLNIEQKDTYQSKKVRTFAKKLRAICNKKITFVNEYLSTKESLEEGTQKKLINKKTSDDSLSAALILKRYYNN